MDISIRAHKSKLPEDFKEITEAKLQSMERFNIPIERIVIEVMREQNPSQGKLSHRVNLTTHGAGPFIRAEGIGHNDVSAFDDAIDGFELQLRKVHERRKDISRDSLRTNGQHSNSLQIDGGL